MRLQSYTTKEKSRSSEDKLAIVGMFCGIIRATDYLARILIEPRKREKGQEVRGDPRVVGLFSDLKGRLIGYVDKGIESGRSYYAGR